MNTKEITAIAIKFLAIWLLIQMALNAPNIFLTLNSVGTYAETKHSMLIYFTAIAAFLIIGIVISYLLFRAANSVLNSFPESNNSETDNISQSFLLQLGGAYFIVMEFMEIIGKIVSAYYQMQNISIAYIPLIGHFIAMAIGLSMLIKSNMWASWFTKLRGRA